jgi:pSer/pThr/pTyr-binding forkhead associated (FHA) protein
MHLEVNNQGKKMLIPLDSMESLTLGRSPRCDIQVVADGISRQHLKILYRDNTYYIVDLATTNGTFVNDEKIEPNQEITFTTFFPIRVGFHVTISLVDDVEPEKEISSAQTTTRTQTRILTQASTPRKKLKLEDEEIVQKKKKKSAGGLFFNLLILIALLGGGYYYYETEIVSKEKPQNRVQVTTPKPQKIVTQKNEEKELSDKSLILKDKCFADSELRFCRSLNQTRRKDFLEGYFIDDKKITYVANLENLKASLKSSYELSNQDRDLLRKNAQIRLRRKYDEAAFINSGFKVQDIDPGIEAKYIALYELENNGFYKAFDPKMYDELRVIIYRPDGRDFIIVWSKRLDSKTLMSLQSNILLKDLIYAAFHGYDLNLRKALDKLRI